MKVVDNMLKLINNSVLIVPKSMKKDIILYINNNDTLLNIKIISLDELQRSIYFSYDEDTILYVMNKYNVKKSIAIKYIDNIYYTYSNTIDNEKYNFLNSLKEELLGKEKLIVDKYFSLFLNRKFIVYGYDYIDKFYLNMLKTIPDVEIITKKESIPRNLDILEFNNIKDECEYVIRSICSLIDNGVDINDIKLNKVDDNYIKELKRLSKLYNLPIDFKSSSIYSTNIVKEYINLLKEDLSFEDVINALKDKFDLTIPNNNYIIKKLIDLSNKYVGLNYEKDLIIESIIEDIKHINNKKVNYDKKIEFVDIINNDLDKYHVFILGLNEGIYPNIYKDEDYFCDLEKEKLNLDTSTDKNLLEKKSLINSFYSINNLYLSYSKSNFNEELYPSSIISDINMTVKKEEVKRDVSYSEEFDNILLTESFDNYTKYGEIDNNLVLLNSNYNIQYKTYNNKFSGIDNKKILNYIKELNLSYSSIDNYYRCAFRYYINNILKLDNYEDTFAIFIGNLFHYILSIGFNDDFDFNKEWDSFLEKRNLRVDEAFFLIKLKKELLFIINYLKEFNKTTGLNNMLFEKRISIDKSSAIPVVFKGFVDKIMYKDNLVSIIDYKTGNTLINLNNSIYGIGMQLPIYLYLVVKSNIFNNPKIIGIYLQKILNNYKNIEDKEISLKLNGYSINDENLLNIFDPTYENSLYIKGMKKSKNGFYSYTKLLSNEDISNLVNLVDKKINDARDLILKGDFSINPKRIGDINEGCSFCKYKDLCFMREEDIINLKEYKDLSFLGGDKNA